MLEHPVVFCRHLDGVVAFIDEHIGEHNVFVHCAIGRGRSAAAAMAWLLAQGEAEDVDGALSLLTDKRPVIDPNERQTRAVAAWHASFHRP